MSNSFTPLSILNPLRRNRAPGETEFSALVQLYPHAALIVDVARDQILQANSAFMQLTTFSMAEVVGRSPREVIPDLPTSSQSTEEPFSALLERRGRAAVPILLQVRNLDAGGQWRIIICQPQEETHLTFVTRVEKFARAVIDLNRLCKRLPVDSIPQSAVDITRQCLDVAAVAIYHIAEGASSATLLAVSGNKSLVPVSFPASEWLRLSQTYIWKPGRRVQTELHRCGRVNTVSYMASTPVGDNALLVAAELGNEPLQWLDDVLDVFGGEMASMLHYTRLYQQTLSESAGHERDLLVWQQIVESAGEGILLLSPDLTITAMNPAAEWMLGYADREVRGQPVENVLIGPERIGPVLEAAREGIPTHNMGNVSLHRRSGQSFPVHLQIIPVQRDQELLAVVIFFTDVSEHEEIRQRTQQLEQRAVLGEVTAVFAHEVRNPINNISTGLQLLSVKLPEDDPNQENITRLVNDCQRLNHLMESVLNFSRHSEHKLEEVNLDLLLKRMLDRWRPRMAKVNVNPFFHITEGTPHISGDPRSLEQVFTNLISNAVEAMSEKGGMLAIRVAPYSLVPGHLQVEVTVTDNGPGIPEEVQERLFEPFVTTKPQGTGLGLAITKRIVTAHHGSIRVNSFPGGTVFHVLLSAFQGEAE